QDNAYFCQDPPAMLTCWLAMDAVTTANGPVRYLRGSHQLGNLPHKPSGVKGNSMGVAEPIADGEWHTALLAPGDALFHHCQTIHESSPNGSDAPRLGLLFVYKATHAQTSEAMREAYQ